MLKPVYALVGTDGLLQQEALAAIVRQLPADVQRVDFDGQNADLAEVLDEARSFALFGGAKLVVVRDADEFLTKHRQTLEEFFADPPNSATMVLRFESLPANQRIHKIIAKSGTIEACQAPKDAVGWVVQRAKTVHGLPINLEAARLLVDLVGNELAKLDNELAKLAISGAKKIGPEEIANSVSFQRERQMWELTNALAAGNPQEAVTRWRQLVQSDSSAEFRAVTWLCLWLENVRKALAMLADGQDAFSIGQALKIWPRDVQTKFIAAVRSLGPAGLRRAIDLLAEIDYQTKTGVGDAASNVERFLLSFAAAETVGEARR